MTAVPKELSLGFTKKTLIVPDLSVVRVQGLRERHAGCCENGRIRDRGSSESEGLARLYRIIVVWLLNVAWATVIISQ